VGVDWSGHSRQALRVAAGVAGRPVMVHCPACEVLVRHSAHADLLVVGSRGRNPVAHLLLGSTSEHCARYAHCSVMVTRVSEQQQPGGRARTFIHGGVR